MSLHVYQQWQLDILDMYFDAQWLCVCVVLCVQSQWLLVVDPSRWPNGGGCVGSDDLLSADRATPPARGKA